MSPETWWDERLKNERTFKFFVENLGDAQMPSRVAVREWARARGMTTVLDAGCGPALDRWAGTGIKWTGLDGSALLAAKTPGVVHAPVDALPFYDQSFDLVYSRHVWEHLPTFEPALREACRVATRAVAVTFFRPPGNKRATRIVDGAYYNDYGLGDVVAAFRTAWPDCAFESLTLPPAKFLPDGELVIFVTRSV